MLLQYLGDRVFYRNICIPNNLPLSEVTLEIKLFVLQAFFSHVARRFWFFTSPHTL